MNGHNLSKRELPPTCVIGLGLIGGSIMRDLAAAGVDVYGYNHSRSGARAASREGFDVHDDLSSVLSRAASDNALIIVAVPMHAVEDVLDGIALYAPNCGVTDVVSVKKSVYDLIRERGMQLRYVGGHPMSGTEDSGWGASREGLFTRAAWAVTYDYAVECDNAGRRVPADWIELFADVCELARICGAEAVPVSVAAHDEAVARVSHLPHVLAEALAIVGDRGGTLAQSLAAGSFRGATRVAGTEPGLVRAMCETNADAVVKTIDEILVLLQDARDSLADPDRPSIEQLAGAGYRAATRMGARKGARAESVSPVKISSRPVMRIQLGAHGWVKALRQTESLGGRIDVF
ncbi:MULTISPECIES: prephenate dehydrogenase [unclassified Corynebacterium]|uniref:prephenate dehydrogenase n=1 Tax=unclassified Corynebacterium TaxID=2624378 RepID=UPI00210D028B